jgi:preprotein translocase subunit SecD
MVRWRILLLGLLFFDGACSTPAKRKVDAPRYLAFRVEALESEASSGVGFKTVLFQGEELLLSPPHRYFIDHAKIADIGSERLGVQYWITKDQSKEFNRWTGGHVGRRMAVILDGEVLCCLKLETALPGSGVLVRDSNGYSKKEAQSIVDRLTSN